MAINTIDWEKIWAAFDEWWDELELEHECPECHHAMNLPGWHDQQDKIRELVEKALKGK